MLDPAKHPYFHSSNRPPYDGDDGRRFTHEEIVAGMRLMAASEDEAVEMALALTQGADGSPLFAIQFRTETLTLIALANADAARRVQELLRESDEQAAARLDEMRAVLSRSDITDDRH
jgi:hypothetical protein